MQTEDRFWARVDKQSGDGCWFWLGAKCNHGYGNLGVEGKSIYAHRFAYELLVSPIPEGLTLDHLCRNRTCVNPAHLEAVDNRTNILRGIGWGAKHARATHCPSEHPYDDANTYLTPNGWRRCRVCAREHYAKWKARKRVKALPVSFGDLT